MSDQNNLSLSDKRFILTSILKGFADEYCLFYEEHFDPITEASRLSFRISYVDMYIVDTVVRYKYVNNIHSEIKHIINYVAERVNSIRSGMRFNDYNYIKPYPTIRALEPGEYRKNKIKKVIFNDPATIVFWGNGDKTVVKCGEEEIFDPEKGLAMAIAKYYLGNKGAYYNTFVKYLNECLKNEQITGVGEMFD